MTSSPGSEHATGLDLLRRQPPLRWRRLPLALLWWGLECVGTLGARVGRVRW